MNQALKQYRSTAAHAEVETANPHRLVQMLLQGALDKIALAKGLIQNKQIEQKGMQINSVIAILGTLQGSLNLEMGGEIAQNLHRLYSYSIKRLTEANCYNNCDYLEDVARLIREIKLGWDQIADSDAATSAKIKS